MTRFQPLILTAIVLLLCSCETYHGLTRDLTRAEGWLDRQSTQLSGAKLDDSKRPTHHR